MRIDTKRKLALRVLSTAALMAMVSSIATAAFADTYYMENGSISIVAKENGNYITQGEIKDHKDEGETVITNQDSSTASKNTVTIKAEEDSTAKVTLKDVNIDVSDSRKAAMTVTGTGDTEIELKGDNTLVSGSGHAGLEKSDTYGSEPSQNGSLTINAADPDSSLTATGGAGGAGIGGASSRSGSNITITGGNITATAGSNTGSGPVSCGAGIGGGGFGEGNNITISGGTVNATGGEGNDFYAYGGAGIGGGHHCGANDIIISGNDTKVIATGKDGGAGIGGGFAGTANKITIAGGTVDATGGSHGAGIGGGGNSYQSAAGSASNITISGDKTHVTATGGFGGAGIGGGAGGGVNNSTAGNASNINISGGAGIGGGTDSRECGNGGVGSNITISGGTVNAVGGRNSAGIGGGDGAGCSGITISGGTVTASSEDGAAGIGGGRLAGAGTADSTGVTITNGTVTAIGGAGAAGIGGGLGAGAYNISYGGSSISISGGAVTATGGEGAAGVGDGASKASDVSSSISITGGTVKATGGAGEAAGIGSGEDDARHATVNISATNSALDVTAVTQGSGEAITGGEDLTMAKLNNRFSGVVRFFRGEDHYNTVHNGKYVGMDDNNADEHKETDAHIWGSTEIIRQATPTEQGILRHHCAVDGCKGYYEEFFDYVAPAEPVTPAPTDPDTPDVPGTPDVTPDAPAQTTPAQSTPAQDTPADAAVTPDATTAQTTATASGEQQITANAALPKTGANWLAVVGSAISGIFLLAAGFVLDRKSRRQN